jgi:DHA2 family multidrug resistance protein
VKTTISADGPGPRPTVRPTNPWVVAAAVTLATFMATLDSSVANVALPFIAGSLSASMDESTSILSSFMVATAIAMPLAGWLAAVAGRKRYYMAGVLIFTVSSALCGLAPSLGWLIAFRVLQGIGGGGLWPTEQGILLDAFPPAKLGMAMGLHTMAVLVGLIAGPIVGGWITDNFSWRWIFYINIPIGCLSLFLAQRFLEDPPHLVAARAAQRGKPLRIDLVGIALIVLSLGTLQVVFDRAQEYNWFGSPLIVWLTAIGLVTLIGAIIWELRHPEPLLHLRLLKDRNFLCCSLVSVVTAATVYGSTMCLPEMLETLFGYTPIEAGMALSPGALVSMVEMPIVGYLLGRRVDARWLIAGGLVIAATGSLDVEAQPGCLAQADSPAALRADGGHRNGIRQYVHCGIHVRAD